jgi:hypothetical protein
MYPRDVSSTGTTQGTIRENLLTLCASSMRLSIEAIYDVIKRGGTPSGIRITIMTREWMPKHVLNGLDVS